MNKYKVYEGDSKGFGIFTAETAEQALADYIFVFDIKDADTKDIKAEIYEEGVVA